MIKIIIHITKFVIATITALLFASCNLNMNTIEGSGNVTTEKRTVQGDFKSVKVSNAIDLVIEQADNYEVIVEADDNLQKDIITKVENGALVIRCKFNSFRNISMKKVTVRMPAVDKIEASSASTVLSKNLLHGESLELETSSAASINVNTEFDTVSCHASSGSSIDIKGKTLKVKTSASSGSSIEAGNLLANDVDADVSSGAVTKVHPILSLKAEASSGGNINYDNVPKTIDKTASSGGSISQG